jgi:hypothetical protein
VVGTDIEGVMPVNDIELARPDKGGATRVWARVGSVNVRTNSRQGEGPGT